MFSKSIIDDSGSINDTSRVVRMIIIRDTSTRSITYYRHSDHSRGVIYDRNILIILICLIIQALV
jgi:hypothetical protein